MLLHLSRQGRGTILVLIHGVAGSSRIWDPIVPELARHYEVVRVDLLGYGRSPKPHIAYTPTVHVEAIHHTLHHHGIKAPFAMAGLSMGTLLVLEYARRWPEDVRQILCIGLPYHRSPEEARLRLRHSAWARLALEQPILGRLAVTVAWGLGRRSRRIAGLFSRLYTADMAQDAARNTYQAFRSSLLHCMVNNRADGLLAATGGIPQRYLHGTDDTWAAPEVVAAALALRPNCQLTLLQDTEHNTVILKPAQTADWMLDVLKTTGP